MTGVVHRLIENPVRTTHLYSLPYLCHPSVIWLVHSDIRSFFPPLLYLSLFHFVIYKQLTMESVDWLLACGGEVLRPNPFNPCLKKLRFMFNFPWYCSISCADVCIHKLSKKGQMKRFCLCTYCSVEHNLGFIVFPIFSLCFIFFVAEMLLKKHI